jgi:ATP-dependent Clp protease protease subunit
MTISPKPRTTGWLAMPCAGRTTAGQATDIDIHAREILRLRESMNQILARHTHQNIEKVQKDVERDYIMTAEQAKEYGIVDQVISKKE